MISQFTCVGHQTFEHRPAFSDVLREGRRFPEQRGGHRRGCWIRGLAGWAAGFAEVDEVVMDRVFEAIEQRLTPFAVGRFEWSTAEINHVRRRVCERQSRYTVLVQEGQTL